MGFPYLPFEDSLFGECLNNAWKKHGRDDYSLTRAVFSFLNPPETNFVFTSNIKKEIILSQAPQEIREFISRKDWKAIGDMLRSISLGVYDNQDSKGIDIAFELAEWLLTGYESEIDFREILNIFLVLDPPITDDIIDSIREYYNIKMLEG
ncbi:hypothetical protein [Leptospira sp. GIMC2001]|uniref:hypothetical protein n=1 Tax=Leptospira sp. GIMC2001 TaxID=1513297 RepID=UPI00234AAC0F|nr:hypothetical protein [Leptospira sp. GIMC2001]WCL47720.1 hypothetical protein O4O04_00250 [Leptospira sp. GIMC2001]